MEHNMDDELLNKLGRKEAESKFQYDQDPDVGSYTIPDWINNEANPTQNQQSVQNQTNNLGKVNMLSERTREKNNRAKKTEP